jgi:hypothetical protein
MRIVQPHSNLRRDSIRSSTYCWSYLHLQGGNRFGNCSKVVDADILLLNGAICSVKHSWEALTSRKQHAITAIDESIPGFKRDVLTREATFAVRESQSSRL